MNIKINHATQKTQRQTHGPTGLCELFLLTVPRGRGQHCTYIYIRNLKIAYKSHHGKANNQTIMGASYNEQC